MNVPTTFIKGKWIELALDVKNAMDASVVVYLGTRLIRSAQSVMGKMKFERLVKGEDAEGKELTLVALVSDFSPSARMNLEISLTEVSRAYPHSKTNG